MRELTKAEIEAVSDGSAMWEALIDYDTERKAKEAEAQISKNKIPRKE